MESSSSLRDVKETAAVGATQPSQSQDLPPVHTHTTTNPETDGDGDDDDDNTIVINDDRDEEEEDSTTASSADEEKGKSHHGASTTANDEHQQQTPAAALSSASAILPPPPPQPRPQQQQPSSANKDIIIAPHHQPQQPSISSMIPQVTPSVCDEERQRRDEQDSSTLQDDEDEDERMAATSQTGTIDVRSSTNTTTLATEHREEEARMSGQGRLLSQEEAQEEVTETETTVTTTTMVTERGGVTGASMPSRHLQQAESPAARARNLVSSSPSASTESSTTQSSSSNSSASSSPEKKGRTSQQQQQQQQGQEGAKNGGHVPRRNSKPDQHDAQQPPAAAAAAAVSSVDTSGILSPMSPDDLKHTKRYTSVSSDDDDHEAVAANPQGLPKALLAAASRAGEKESEMNVDGSSSQPTAVAEVEERPEKVWGRKGKKAKNTDAGDQQQTSQKQDQHAPKQRDATLPLAPPVQSNNQQGPMMTAAVKVKHRQQPECNNIVSELRRYDADLDGTGWGGFDDAVLIAADDGNNESIDNEATAQNVLRRAVEGDKTWTVEEVEDWPVGCCSEMTAREIFSLFFCLVLTVLIWCGVSFMIVCNTAADYNSYTVSLCENRSDEDNHRLTYIFMLGLPYMLNVFASFFSPVALHVARRRHGSAADLIRFFAMQHPRLKMDVEVCKPKKGGASTTTHIANASSRQGDNLMVIHRGSELLGVDQCADISSVALPSHDSRVTAIRLQMRRSTLIADQWTEDAVNKALMDFSTRQEFEAMGSVGEGEPITTFRQLEMDIQDGLEDHEEMLLIQGGGSCCCPSFLSLFWYWVWTLLGLGFFHRALFYYSTTAITVHIRKIIRVYPGAQGRAQEEEHLQQHHPHQPAEVSSPPRSHDNVVGDDEGGIVHDESSIYFGPVGGIGAATGDNSRYAHCDRYGNVGSYSMSPMAMVYPEQDYPDDNVNNGWSHSKRTPMKSAGTRQHPRGGGTTPQHPLSVPSPPKLRPPPTPPPKSTLPSHVHTVEPPNPTGRPPPPPVNSLSVSALHKARPPTPSSPHHHQQQHLKRISRDLDTPQQTPHPSHASHGGRRHIDLDELLQDHMMPSDPNYIPSLSPPPPPPPAGSSGHPLSVSDMASAQQRSQGLNESTYSNVTANTVASSVNTGSHNNRRDVHNLSANGDCYVSIPVCVVRSSAAAAAPPQPPQSSVNQRRQQALFSLPPSPSPMRRPGSAHNNGGMLNGSTASFSNFGGGSSAVNTPAVSQPNSYNRRTGGAEQRPPTPLSPAVSVGAYSSHQSSPYASQHNRSLHGNAGRLIGNQQADDGSGGQPNSSSVFGAPPRRLSYD